MFARRVYGEAGISAEGRGMSGPAQSVFEALRADGLSLRQIAKITGVSHETARKRVAGVEYPLRFLSNDNICCRKWRALHPGYFKEYCKQWRARKQRQAKAIEKIWREIERWEYVKRCVEISHEAAEARARR
jgi:hypothetical protein